MSQKKAEPRKTKSHTKRTINVQVAYQVSRGEITITVPGAKIADLVFDDFLARHGKQESLPFTQPENEKP